jgi:hypothetical protein
MAEEPYAICEWCREEIDPEASDTLKAVELVPVPTFGKPNDVAEGLGVLFHKDCFHGLPGYKLV